MPSWRRSKASRPRRSRRHRTKDHVPAFFRCEDREGIEEAIPRTLYEDGFADRPENCKGEIAFAYSPGGSVYGAAQYKLYKSHASQTDKIQKQDWLDNSPWKTFYVYGTDANEPDYEAGEGDEYATFRDEPISTDYHITGEVRFCKPVKVYLWGIVTLTNIHRVFLESLIYLHHDYDYFVEGTDLSRVLDGDISYIESHLRPKPIDKWDEEKSDEPNMFEAYEFTQGINDDNASIFTNWVDAHLKKMPRPLEFYGEEGVAG